MILAELVVKRFNYQPYYYARIRDSNNSPVDLSNLSLYATMISQQGTTIVSSAACTVDSATGGLFHFKWTGNTNSTSQSGIYYMEFTVVDSTNGNYTVPPNNSAVVRIVDDFNNAI